MCILNAVKTLCSVPLSLHINTCDMYIKFWKTNLNNTMYFELEHNYSVFLILHVLVHPFTFLLNSPEILWISYNFGAFWLLIQARSMEIFTKIIRWLCSSGFWRRLDASDSEKHTLWNDTLCPPQNLHELMWPLVDNSTSKRLGYGTVSLELNHLSSGFWNENYIYRKWM